MVVVHGATLHGSKVLNRNSYVFEGISQHVVCLQRVKAIQNKTYWCMTDSGGGNLCNQ